MKNKFIIIFMFLIFILFIPSFSHAVNYDDDGTTITLPDFNVPEGTSDMVLFDYGNGSGYYLFGFEDKESASKCYLWNNSGSTVIWFSVPSGTKYWTANCTRISSNYPFYWTDNAGIASFTWSVSSGRSWSIGSTDYDFHSVYNTFDIKWKNGDIAFEDSTKLKLNLSVVPEEKTNNVPVLIVSDWYLLEKWNTSLEVTTENQMYDVYMHIPQVDDPIRY